MGTKHGSFQTDIRNVTRKNFHQRLYLFIPQIRPSRLFQLSISFLHCEDVLAHLTSRRWKKVECNGIWQMAVPNCRYRSLSRVAILFLFICFIITITSMLLDLGFVFSCLIESVCKESRHFVAPCKTHHHPHFAYIPIPICPPF